MKLQGRHLNKGLNGDDVKLLHFELKELGFLFPDEEVARETFGDGTFKVVSRFQASHQLKPTGVVDEITATAINRDFDALSMVQGQVRQGDDTPFTAGKVQAFDKDLRSEQLLGEAELSDQGKYEIRYSADKFARAEKRLADLIVRVLNRAGQDQFSSDVIFNAPARLTVDIVLEGQVSLSEFERCVKDIQPLLERVKLPELTEADIDFVAGETEIPEMHIAFLAVAYQHAATTSVGAELFYGLFRENAPTSLPALLTQSHKTLRTALDSAIEQQFIPGRTGAELDRAILALLRQRGQHLLKSAGETSAISGLLGPAGLNGDQQGQFLEAYLDFDGDSTEFWKSLETTPLSGQVRSIQNSLQLGLLTQNNVPLLQTLGTRRVRSVRDLARMKPEELQKIVLESKEILAAIPAKVDSENDDARAVRFSNELFELLHDAIPTAFVQDAFERSTDTALSAAGIVLSRLPDFELRDDDLDQALLNNAGALDGVVDSDKVKSVLKRMQRTLRVAPHPHHAQLLLDEGLDSAASITSLSAADFQERFADKLGGAAQTNVYYRRAQQVSDTVLAIMSTLQQSITDVMPAVIERVPDSVKSLPNFTTLFGSQSLCTCSHCRSVLSPAAYLVDLLEFLNPKSPKKPITRLRSKRPDLEHILLTCDNTNTPLPYIDLVNEVLEFYVAQGTLTADAVHNTSEDVSAAELNANPQFVIQAAYDTLSNAVYPPTLPFHRPLKIARLYLKHVGTSRSELMRACQRDGSPSEIEIACESLQISPLEREIVTGNSGRTLPEFYNLPATPSPETLTTIKVAAFLKCTSLTCEQLLQILKTDYLNPNAAIKLVDEDNPPQCNLDRISLTNLTPVFWQNTHRFLRLHRITGWTVAELDLMLMCLQIGNIDDDSLIRLEAMKQLQSLTKLAAEVLASLFGTINTRSSDSLYEKLFLNKAVLNSSTLAVFEAVRDGNSTAVLGDHRSTISAALRLNAADIDLLLEQMGFAASTLITVESLSSLHRYAVLARAMNLSIRDSIDLSILTNQRPFVEQDPCATILFIDAVKKVRDSGFTIAELNYLYRHVSETTRLLQPTIESQLLLLRTLKTSLQTSQAGQLPENATDDQHLEALRISLQEVVEEAQLDQCLLIIQGKDELTSETREVFVKEHFKRFLDPDEAVVKLLSPATVLNDRITYVEQALTLYKQKGLVIQILSEALGIESRLMVLLLQDYMKSVDASSEPLLQSFLRLLQDSLQLTVESAVTSELDSGLIPILDGLLRLQKAALLVRRFEMKEDEVRLFTEQGASFNGFDWNELPIKAEDGPEELLQLPAWHRLAGWYRLRKVLLRQAAELADVGLAATSDAATEPNAIPIDRRANAIDKLKLATARAADEIDFLVGPNGFNMALATDFLDERKLARVMVCLDISRRLGVSCATIFHWSGVPVNTVLADAMVAAAKAKHSEEQWLSIAKPLNDELRERQKSALISYVLAHDAGVQNAGITDGNGLFEYFLIDVEMSACAKTSRIRQAISSVQLFIQRCLLNLEDGVSPSAIDIERWEWIKNYRVWEANRKVFLYPENWIEPELRDDKSPFFQELESTLLQNDLSWSTAEDAYVKYLEKLDQVARLQPCGMYVEEAEEPGDDEIVHVFGRTMSSPHIHYYRKLINGHRWTPWEKLDQEIDGEHLIPVVRNRRLYLMWLTFEEKPDVSREISRRYVQSLDHWRWVNREIPAWEAEHAKWTKKHTEWLRLKSAFDVLLSKLPADAKAEQEKLVLGDEPLEPHRPEEPEFSIQPPLTHWEIKLAWIEHKDGQWSPRRTSTEHVESPHVQTTFQQWFGQDWVGLKKENADHGFIPLGLDGKLEETVFSVHLPKKETHFARIVDLSLTANGNKDDGLTIWLFRRFSHKEVVFRKHLFPIRGFDLLGFFRIRCGSKVDIVPLDSPAALPFESLKRPDGTTNTGMTFAHAAQKNALSITPGKKRKDILRKGTGAFELLYEHQHAEFRLVPPFQNFFYHDAAKTYFVSYGIEIPSSVLKIPGHAIIGVALNSHADLVDSIAKREPVRPKPRNLLDRQVLTFSNSSKPGSDSQYDDASTRSAIAIKTFRNSESAGMTVLAGSRTVLTSKIWLQPNHVDSVALAKQGLRFETFFHPHLCEWMKRLYRDGLAGFLTRDSQRLDNRASDGKTLFEKIYDPSTQVVHPYPTECVDFDRGTYACYNWELFFHIPMLIAVSLGKNQRFEDAMKWFHFVFNPMTDDPGASRQRYWNTVPFFQNTGPEQEQIQNLLLKLAGKKPGWKEIEAQIDEWRTNPFNPHLIARMRLTGYQKHVVLKYIDNIIAWGDQLFSRDTLESINEATMLYILAWNILGKRPQTVARHEETAPKSYQQLAKDLDAFGNALIDVEGIVPYQSVLKSGSKVTSPQTSQKQVSQKPVRRPGGAGIHKSAIRTLNFCVPPNEEMLRYWDTVEDRLFKIRHCMNIEGASRQLPLFEPPIDPALLVKAKAAGLDLGSVLSDMFAPVPHYRFNVMLQKATELCNELKSLGGALLSALEKRDAETISNLRASQESNLLKSIRDLKRQQIDEARANIEALRKARLTTEARYSYYRDIERISDSENEQLDDMLTAHRFNTTSQGLQAAASAAYYIPTFTTGTSGVYGSPVTTVEFGGSTIGPALQSGATIASMIAAEFSYQGMRSSIVGSYARRWDDWKLQETLASRELDQIDKQIAASEIRLAITEKELENHEQQIADSEAVEEFLRSKYTNEELYNWMIAQSSKVYFQTYKLAYDLAKRAERTYRIELGLNNSDFVRFGYWDNLRKGLLAGEQLALDLKRMDASCLEKNKREYELAKHVSLLQLAPEALIQLRQTGECDFNIPEWWFDLDNPGHYLRRIKNVSLSIPCVTGPYTGVNCTLSLERSETRITALNAADGNSYRRVDNDDDPRFAESFGLVQSIVVSTAQNDSGLFETNFSDERYLPFENAGVISRWKLRLPADPRTDFLQFDYDTISDVVLHVRYTARDGGDILRKAALEAVKQETEPESSAVGLTRLFSVRQEFPTAWARFQNQVASDDSLFPLTLNLRREHYPFWARRLNLVTQVEFFVRSKENPLPGSIDIAIPPADNMLSLTQGGFGDLFVEKMPNPFTEPTGDLKLELKSKAISDVWIAVTISNSATS